ncbi:MAG: hypothetical protein K8M05_16900, partial [Deltaproteobacteria bacterium]|nr:hypothetical protein [Kofleriaceae bacterium]
MRLGISTRLAGATALLIVAIVGVMVWQWASTERQIVSQQKRDEARAFAVAMADVLMNELDDENWAQIRVSTEVLLVNNQDIVYVLVHDRRKDDRIVGAVPSELGQQFIPDVVPLAVTRAGLAAEAALTQESFLLRAVAIGKDTRAPRGSASSRWRRRCASRRARRSGPCGSRSRSPPSTAPSPRRCRRR